MFPSLPPPPGCALRKQQFKGTVPGSWSGVPSGSCAGEELGLPLPLGEGWRCSVQLLTLRLDERLQAALLSAPQQHPF